MNRKLLTASRAPLALASLALLGLLSACGRQDEAMMGEPPAAGVQQGAPTVAEAPADAAITAEIKAKFAADAQLAALPIAVHTRDGLVELNGKAPDASLRDHATRVAARAKNVLSVDNHMAVPRS